MNVDRTLKLILIILLLAVCSAAVADCHGDFCNEFADNCSQGCEHVCCTHAILHNVSVIGFSSSYYAYSVETTSAIPHISPDAVFQPPRTAV